MPSVEISRFRKLVQRVEDLAHEYGIELRRRTLKDGGLTGQTIIKVNSEDLNYNWGYYNWNNVTGKPTNFPTTIGSVSGLTTSLDSKLSKTNLLIDKTITPSNVIGPVTINKPAGSVNLGAGQSTLVVTNSLVSANSLVFLTIQDLDIDLKAVVNEPTAGSFTIYADQAAASNVQIGFLVVT